MQWIGMLFISPTWGCLSTVFFFQVWLGIANLVIHFFGFLRGNVARSVTALGMAVDLFGIFLFLALFRGGLWVITDFLPFGRTDGENISYWIFVALSTPAILIQVPAKLRKTWRNATISGSFEGDIAKRKMGINPEYD